LRELRHEPAHLRIVGQLLRRGTLVARQPVQCEIALALLLDQAVDVGLRALDPGRIDRILDADKTLFVELSGERGGIHPIDQQRHHDLQLGNTIGRHPAVPSLAL
jgi:hypothetical protein